MLRSVSRSWFPCAMIGCLTVGALFPLPLRPLADSVYAPSAILVLVMFVTALPFEASQLANAIRRPWAAAIAVFVSLGITPPVAWVMAQTLESDLGAGLLVAATTPCTIVSAAVWTRRAGGNDAVALVVIVITNLACVLVTPTWLVALTGKMVASIQLSFPALVFKLCLLIIIPMVVAQALRVRSSCVEWVARNKSLLNRLGQIGILCMVLIGAIQAGLRMIEPDPTAQSWVSLVWMAILALSLHLAMFWTAFYLAKWAGLPFADQFAAAISGSQKTLTVGIAVATTLRVSVFPMVAYHMLQLIADTWIADRMALRNERDQGHVNTCSSRP